MDISRNLISRQKAIQIHIILRYMHQAAHSPYQKVHALFAFLSYFRIASYMPLKYQLHRIILITLNDTINIDSGQTMEREREREGKKACHIALWQGQKWLQLD